MQSLILLIYEILELFKWVLLISVVASWLVSFIVISPVVLFLLIWFVQNLLLEYGLGSPLAYR
jgi:hypothetical protein